MVRPNFTRAQVADLEMFEVHVSHLIDSVPRDGSTVDLQDLFFGLTMDSATEFLFGKSTNTLAPGLETKSANDFVKAFVYVTEGAFHRHIVFPASTDERSHSLFAQFPIWRLGQLHPRCEMAKERQ